MVSGSCIAFKTDAQLLSCLETHVLTETIAGKYLSFKLLGVDYLLTRELNGPEANLAVANPAPRLSQDASMYGIGKVMAQTQQWLYRHSRDILDESDEILSVRFELIHTIGIQQNVEFGPDRWTIIQHVLGVLAETAQEIS
jgi:hypothetical protein